MDIRVAAIPMSADAFDVERNTQRALDFVDNAAQSGAELVLLPELFGIGYSYEPQILTCGEARHGMTADRLTEISASADVYVGGSFIEISENRLYNTFVLASPNGELHFYRKRSLPIYERLYFSKGAEPGIFETPIGRIGVLLCWDITNKRSLSGIRHQVDFVLISSAWPDASRGNVKLPWLGESLSRIAMNRPRAIARYLGVPVLVCNMGGRFCTRLPYTLFHYQSPFVRSTALFGPTGEVINRAEQDDAIMAGTLKVGQAA